MSTLQSEGVIGDTHISFNLVSMSNNNSVDAVAQALARASKQTNKPSRDPLQCRHILKLMLTSLIVNENAAQDVLKNVVFKKKHPDAVLDYVNNK